MASCGRATAERSLAGASHGQAGALALAAASRDGERRAAGGREPRAAATGTDFSDGFYRRRKQVAEKTEMAR